MTQFTPVLALITGASSGIGLHLARRLAADGVDLILVARREHELLCLAEELHDLCHVTCFPCDLGKEEERRLLCRLIQERTPDLIVNNAGFGLYGNVLSHPSAAHKEVLAVNGEAIIDLSHTGAKALIEQGKEGVILNVASVAGLIPMCCFTSYAASKAFVVSWSLAFDAEVAEKGVRILVSCPGKIGTNFGTVAAQGRAYQVVSSGVMDVEYAVQRLYKQIQQRKGFVVFDWRYRILSWLGRYLPVTVVQKIVKTFIQRG